MILRIIEVRACESYSLWLAFNDGSAKRVAIGPLLEGPIFEPLQDPGYFARAASDPACRTVVWPNGADFAPEVLHGLVAEVDARSTA